MAKSRNMFDTLCLPDAPKLSENTYHMWADKVEFLLTQSGVDYAF